MQITSSAPTRIDLSGGTVDIWPLYLFHKKARTINIAIDQRAKVKIERRPGTAVEIRSEDLDVAMRLQSIDYITDVEEGHPLSLAVKLLDFFRPEGSLSITTSSMSPPGAGLGGSSALAIAMSGALNTLTGSKYSREELITITKNVETQILKKPAGVQDYYPAMYGGLSSVLLEVTGETLLRHSHLLTHAIDSRLVLVFSGKSHHSGMNNWEIVKSYLDGDAKVQEAFRGIQSATLDLEHALKTGNFARVGEAMEQDMEYRRKLWPGVMTPELEELVAFGKEHGARAAKVCGAGGGGCLVFWVGGSQDKIKLTQKLRERDARIINFHVDSEGLAVHAK